MYGSISRPIEREYFPITFFERTIKINRESLDIKGVFTTYTATLWLFCIIIFILRT
jgi:hypothetical protein